VFDRLLPTAFTGNNGRVTIRRTARGFDLVKRLLAAALLLVLLSTGMAYAIIAAALPRRGGQAELAGLEAPLTVALDSRAIATVRGESFDDVLRGQGYLHAQERFFQMDLLRRSSAGELAELFGERALAADRGQRPFGYREIARRVGSELSAEQNAWLDAYTEGVNAGLADLGARPPEYWLAGAAPRPWSAEDTLLVVLTFYTMLSNNDSYERGQGVMHATLPPALYDLLTPSTSRFDRPVLGGSPNDPTGGYVPLPIPGADVVDLRRQRAPARGIVPRVEPPLIGPGSNNWAVDRARSATGNAILANDPHLSLRMPNIFYRIELEWPEGAARGVSIPGLPGVLIGASDDVAWGATVSNADQSDWVVVEVDPADASRYRTPDGYERFVTSTSEIAVAGGDAVRVETRATRWGPVVAEDWLGRPLALHATWLEPQGLDLDIVGIAAATDVASASTLLARWAGPSLNWLLADRHGDIGWVVNGPLPRRVGFDGSRPESLADGSRSWQGRLPPPGALGGRDGVLYTANNRTLSGDRAAAVSRMWMRPLRAKRIDDLLAEQRTFDERAFLAMQLDTRAEGYEQMRATILEVVAADEREPRLEQARKLAAAWNGHADVDQPALRLLHAYYRALTVRTLEPLLEPAIAADPTFVYRWPLADEVLRRLLDERPAHLLTSEHADWPGFLRTVLGDTLAALEENGPLDTAWGDVNVLDVAHPFAAALGPFASRLSLPRAPLPGSMISLRVAAPSYGAVLRMAVAPASPGDGVLEFPGGQSGHFLSPHFRDQLKDWVDGAPSPFLAGEPVSQFVLVP
jgi:penicillin amidase